MYAAHPGEPVLSFDVVSALMPLASATAPQTYKFALAIGLAIPLIAAVFGLLPFAIATAAVVVPVVYVLYLYDVNEWEDEPVSVVLGTVAVAAALALGFTLIWHDGILGSAITFGARASDGVTVDGRTLVVIGLLVPVIGELLKQVGPLWLSMRPRFDDLIDAVTFGVTSGATFAAVETLVVNRELIFSGQTHFANTNAATWVSLVVTAGLVKPVVYGAASGIALAAFSGLGDGYDGFKPSYFQGLAEAIFANIAFQVGIYLTGLAGGTTGVVLGMLWGLVVAAALVLRLRVVLHNALLEGALQHVTNGTASRHASQGIGFCAECELPLLDGASFCVACGASVRAGSKLTRRANSEPTEVRA